MDLSSFSALASISAVGSIFIIITEPPSIDSYMPLFYNLCEIRLYA